MVIGRTRTAATMAAGSSLTTRTSLRSMPTFVTSPAR